MNPKYNIFFNTVEFSELKLAFKSLFKLNFEDEKKIKTFENKFSKLLKYKFSYSFGSGRMCFYNILCAIDAKKGDEIILPAYTCAVVSNAILYKGLKPIYVDISLKDFNQDMDEVIKKISKKTKVIYIQNTYGVDCNIKKLKKISKKKNLIFIEDNTHSLHKSKLSSLKNYFGYFSTDHSKMINTHSGGIVVCDNKKFAKTMKKIQKNTPFLKKFIVLKILITYILEFLFLSPRIFRIGKFAQSVLQKIGLMYYFQDELQLTKPDYYPCRLSSVQAELALLQISKIKKNLNHRRKIVTFLEKNLKWYNFSKKKN